MMVDLVKAFAIASVWFFINICCKVNDKLGSKNLTIFSIAVSKNPVP